MIRTMISMIRIGISMMVFRFTIVVYTCTSSVGQPGFWGNTIISTYLTRGTAKPGFFYYIWIHLYLWIRILSSSETKNKLFFGLIKCNVLILVGSSILITKKKLNFFFNSKLSAIPVV